MKKFLKELSKRFQKKVVRIDKRVRFVVSALLLGALMLFSTFFYFDKWYIFLPLLIILTYLVTYFSLAEGIEKLGWFGLFVMPIAVSASFYLVYFLFPGRWLTRIPFIIFYEISIYAMIVCSNIFNVGVEKNLGLYRAAFSINFLYQAIVSFLIFNLVFALKANFIINGAISGVIGIILGLNLFWTIRLKRHLEAEVKNYSILLGLVMFELALLASFLPLATPVYALFLTGGYYSLAGLIYNHMDEKLFIETIREYVVVFSFVLLITYLSLSW